MEPAKQEQYSILVVEDDKEIRNGIEIFLRSQGYEVYQAADGIEGLEMIKQHEIHLINVNIKLYKSSKIKMYKFSNCPS